MSAEELKARLRKFLEKPGGMEGESETLQQEMQRLQVEPAIQPEVGPQPPQPELPLVPPPPRERELIVDPNCRNLPPLGDPLPTVLTTGSRILRDPARIRIALDYARLTKKIPTRVFYDPIRELEMDVAAIRRRARSPEPLKRLAHRPGKERHGPSYCLDASRELQRERERFDRERERFDRERERFDRSDAERRRLAADLIRIRGEREQLRILARSLEDYIQEQGLALPTISLPPESVYGELLALGGSLGRSDWSSLGGSVAELK